MTDEEIIKALECCSGYTCEGCPFDDGKRTMNECVTNLSQNAFDLIKRKDAEIERLKKILENRGEICKLCEGKYTEKIKHAKAKAIKEFAERLKEHIKELKIGDNIYLQVVGIGRIDNLVKEMVGE